MANNDVICVLEADNINYRSICCEKIPELFLDKLVAKNHFSKFGKITRFILRPSRQSCTVEYETEDQAERALMEAGNYNGHKFKIDYAEREVAHVQNTEEWVDSDVQAELEAMSPGQRLVSGPMVHRQAQPLPPAAPASKMPTRMAKPAAQMLPPKVAKAPPPAELPKVDAAVRQELEAILRRPAYSDEDKYRVLDARDKLIRLTTVRQTDIKTAVSTKGTCPDMCPEKERLMREFQRQVSSFETSSGYESDASNISHKRAIKEYSRSSADQEVPLSHELRPESVLKMTMLYLMHRIMDLCDDASTSLADWFHFVWDRTRSIRKDITQQELCSLGTVQLVEQCARFHIHCAARLVAEDSAVFDKKINAENLTKCLQSLKYMYHDLRIKCVHCPCEAEFRSYIVLLNMGDANFLWELKQLPAHIQNSNEIRRAIAFYNALQNNNYVRFFDMIRSPETSYLSACILLGYFNKLRWRAMEAINKSHNWRKNAVFLPLAYLTKVLGFEDANATAHYFRYHGLQCDKERVLLDRLKRPDTEYSMERALKLVESKRTVTVGECVCGQPLDSPNIFEKHEPHNSFDANSVLRPESWGAEDQLRGDMAVAKALERKQQQSRLPPPVKTQTPLPPPPTVRTDANIFKVPQALAPISPKQQQQKANVPSIFGGIQHNERKPASATPVATNFRFDADVNSLKAPASTSSQSIFKIPTVSAKQASSAASLGTSIFQPSIERPPPAATCGNIFDSAVQSGQSIFGAAAKETSSIFGERLQPPQPQPLKSDNIFQHFQTPASTPAFGGSSVPSIFGSGASKSLTQPNGEPLAKQPFKHAADSQLTFEIETNKHAETLREQHEAAEAKRRQKLKEEEEELEALEQQKQQALAMLHEQQQREVELQRQRELAEKRRLSLEALTLKAEVTTKRELKAMVGEEISSIAHAEVRKYQRYEQHCQQLLDTTIQECVCEQVDELATEEYAVMCHDQMLLCRYFERWLQHTRKKLQQRALMESTPIWVTTDTRAEQTAELLHPSQHENLRMIKRYRYGEPCDFKVLLWQAPRSPVPPAVDICSIVARHTVQRQVLKAGRLQLRKYFKLLLTLPTDEEELPGFASLCDKWLQKHVRQPPQPGTTTPEQRRANAAYICAAEHQVALCVRKLNGMVPLNEQGVRVRTECDHADAIVCCLSSVNLQRTRKRLHHLLKLSNIHKSVPVGFVVYNGDQDERQLAEVLELDELVDEGKVAAYKFCGCLDPKSQFSFSHQLSRALRFVARESSFCNVEAEALEMQSLQSWLEVSLGEEMWQRWHESAQRNPAFGKICCTPRHVIGIYNEALERLLEIATEDMEEAPEFPSELRDFVPKLEFDIPLSLEYFPPDWKTPTRQQQIAEFLSRLQLPTVAEPCPKNLEQLELWLLNYAGRCIPQHDDAATQAGFEAIKALIAQLNAAELQLWPLSERLGMVSFLPVIRTLAFAKTKHVLKEYRQRAVQRQLPAEIIYRRQSLLDYQMLPWWLNSKPVEAVTVDYTQPDDELTAASEQQRLCEAAQNAEQELEEIIARAEQVSRKAEQNLCTLRRQSVNTSSCELSRELDSSLYQFELAKQIGAFDVSFVEQLTDEIDAELEGAVGGACNERGGGDGDGDKLLPACRKRKHIDSERNEIDDIMTRALSIIEKVESLQDRSERLQRTAMLELEFL